MWKNLFDMRYRILSSIGTFIISSENIELIVITCPYVVVESYKNDNKEK